LANSTTKKVYVRCSDGKLIEGYVSPHAYLRREGAEVLDRSAEAVTVPYGNIRAIYFVREFEGEPEASHQKTFHSRPKLNGLWVRLEFRGGEIFEGILSNDLLLVGEYGITVTPPDPHANAQKIFVPRQALEKVTVLGVIGSPVGRGRKKRAKAPSKDQISLFDEGAQEKKE